MQKFDFNTSVALMFEGALSATEAAEVAKILEAMEERTSLRPLELCVGLGASLSALNPESKSYSAVQRSLKAVLRGLGKKFTSPVQRFLSEENFAEGSDLFNDYDAIDKMSNFELMYNINEHYRKQREARFVARYDGRLARFNATGPKGKGKKAGSKGGGNGFIKVGDYTDPESGKTYPMIYEVAADKIIGTCPAGRPDLPPLGLEPILENGRASSAMHYTRADQTNYLDSPSKHVAITKEGGRVKRNVFTRRELHEKITRALEQWEKENNREAVFSDGREALPSNTEIHIDEGSFTLMPLPCEYPVGTDYIGNSAYVPSEMAATVTVSGIPDGQRAVITIGTESVDGKTTMALPSAEDARKAKPVQVKPNGKGNPYQGLACTKCGTGVQTNSIKAYAPKITVKDARINDALSTNLVWEGFEVCGKCRTTLEQEVQKKEALFRKAVAAEAKLLEFMASLIEDENALTEANENAASQEATIAKMRKDGYAEPAIKTMEDALKNFKFNTVGPLEKKVTDGNSKMVAMEKNSEAMLKEAGIADSAVTNGTDTKTSEDKAPASDPNKAKIIKNADGSEPKPEEKEEAKPADNKAVTKPAAKFNTMGPALAHAGITKNLTRAERRAANKAAKNSAKRYNNKR